MECSTFFEHYRLSNEYNGSPTELGRLGPAIIYKAADLRSGAPVSLTLLPVASVDPDTRERFEQQARAAEKLDHVNIAKTFQFGTVGDQYAFVTEYPQGETVGQWIAAHGPMPPDAVLRIALQVVSALGSASFVGLTHPAIQPSKVMIVSGCTAEGGWPCVKLVDFPLAALKLAPGQPDENALASEFASPEQLQLGTTDFRSEIYSLGATMCFLLTGAFYSAEPRSLQTRRFARPLRKLITPMLQQNPDERPQDPVLVAQALRTCLQKVERRQALARKLGLSFAATKPIRQRQRRAPRPLEAPVPSIAPEVMAPAPELARAPTRVVPVAAWSQRRSSWRPVAVWTTAALLVLLIVGAILLPAPASLILRRNRDKDALGVPIGVPDPSTARIPQSSPPPQPSFQPASTIASGTSSTAANNIAAATQVSSPPTQVPAQPVQPAASASTNDQAAGNTTANPTTGVSPAEASPATNGAASMATASTVTMPVQSQSPQPEASGPENTIAAAPPAAAAAAPTEGPQTVWEQESGTKQKIIAQQSDNEQDTPSRSDTKPAAKKTSRTSRPNSSRTHSASTEIVSNAKRSRTSRYERSRTSQSLSDEDREFQAPYQPYHQDEPVPSRRALPAVPHGSFRARVVGTTPGGDLILRLPSGEIAIVPNRNRPRHIWIERPPFAEPPPRSDFALPFPPDA